MSVAGVSEVISTAKNIIPQSSELFAVQPEFAYHWPRCSSSSYHFGNLSAPFGMLQGFPGIPRNATFIVPRLLYTPSCHLESHILNIDLVASRYLKLWELDRTYRMYFVKSIEYHCDLIYYWWDSMFYHNPKLYQNGYLW